MSLHLDGGFWAPWFQKSFVPEIDALREALLTRLLPALPDAAEEAESRRSEAWEAAMTSISDGSDDNGTWADWALEQGIAHYDRLAGVQQAIMNMGTVMLWHLLEQQMLSFHRRQVLNIHEEHQILREPKAHRKVFTTAEFERRLKAGGYDLTQLSSWKKVDELRLVANTVKHGAGDSARRLSTVRPDLFSYPTGDGYFNQAPPLPYMISRPAAGDDIYVSEQDLGEYFSAAETFWREFGSLICQEI